MRWILAAALLLSILHDATCGIKGLAPLLAKEAPRSFTDKTLDAYRGHKIAIDASMAMYQFLIAVRAYDSSGVQTTLQDADGQDTSHLLGFFWRTIAMVKAGIKPLYVFDGKPPILKGGELANRNMRRAEGERKLKEAEADGDVDAMNKMSKRTTRVTKVHTEECKRLLTLMGVPILQAPCEAEAQCAELTKTGHVHAVATEDMDALCCGAKVLVRRLTMSEARKQPIQEFVLEKVLTEIDLDMDRFVDMCLLCGSDFCETIKGVGPKTALNLIRKHKDLDGVIAALNGTKHQLPEYFPYKEAREILRYPEVTKEPEINWAIKVDEEGVVNFLCKEKGFSEKRVRGGLNSLRQARVTPSIPQTRLDSFFKPAAPKVADAQEEEEEERAKGGGKEEEGKKGEEGEEEEDKGKGGASEKSPARKFGGKKRGREG